MTKKLNLTKETEAFLNNIENENAKPLYEMPAEDARKFLLSVQRKTPVTLDADVTDRIISCPGTGDVDIRIVKPLNSNEKLPGVIYAHGGGWVMGDKEVYDNLAKRIAIDAGCAVIFVNYKRSPEYTYPYALNEVCGVLGYITRYPDEFNIDASRIAIAGDSAGGNLAAACALKTSYEGGTALKAQVLLYPVTEASMNTKSYEEFKNGPWLSKKSMEYFWNAYLPDKKVREEIYASPLRADLKELENLPPTLIITAENDVLRDEGEEYAQKLNLAGVNSANIRINGTIHDFMMLNALSKTAPVNAAFISICGFLKKTLNKK